MKDKNDVEEARGVYMAAIMDVGDCLSSLEEDHVSRSEITSYAVQLWINYAGMEIGLKQWKKAVAVYDEALSDQFVSRSGLIYKAYSNYCRDRNRLPSAQKAIVKGLIPTNPDQLDKSLTKQLNH